MPLQPAAPELPSNWIALRTLVLVRWVAIAGQTAALLMADIALGIGVPLGPALAVIGASVIANLLAMFLGPLSRRLTDREAVLILLFDLGQLALLLGLTGGLHNPFALLIVAPATIAATALSLRSTLLMGAATLVLVTALSLWHLPLRTKSGGVLQVPPIFLFGFWLAIVIGVGFLAIYARRVSTEMRGMAEALLATQMALAREQKLTDLGGVVAAAAHELGTPLATIKLVSTELIEEAEAGADPARLCEDLALIRDQADRCRDILRSMGRAGKDDLQVRQAPLGEVLREAAEPHGDRGKILIQDLQPGEGGDPRQPQILRSPEVIHGLRNLIQNAVDFAESTVWIDAVWTAERITVRIIDDGPGFPGGLLGRIGDPFLRSRPGGEPDTARPGYEGMGLGLFIAKTLLERTGAELNFANGSDPFLSGAERPARCGAIVEIVWPTRTLTVDAGARLGDNRPNLP